VYVCGVGVCMWGGWVGVSHELYTVRYCHATTAPSCLTSAVLCVCARVAGVVVFLNFDLLHVPLLEVILHALCVDVGVFVCRLNCMQSVTVLQQQHPLVCVCVCVSHEMYTVGH
jgi:hypothetical protein